MNSTPSSTAASEPTAIPREKFNTTTAPLIAQQLALPPQHNGAGFSQRFAYFADAERFAVVAGAQEKGDIELALAYGIRYAAGRQLTLVLPEGHTNATEQRVPWLA